MALDEGLERMVSALKQTGRYEVLRRFEPPPRYASPDSSALSVAVAVDVETTGRDNQNDHIIQFSAVPFAQTTLLGRRSQWLGTRRLSRTRCECASRQLCNFVQ